MRVSDYWPPTARIIEIGATDGALAQCLLNAGYTGYLAIARYERCRSRILRQHAALAGHIVVTSTPNIVGRNNAEVLILNGRSLLSLARFRAVRHAGFVGWRLRPTLVCVLASLIAVVQLVLGRLAWPRIVGCESAELNRKPPRGYRAARRLRLIVWRVRRPQLHTGVRRFIPHRLGVPEFFRHLQQHDVQYTVLRWFESLPDVAPGEDIDLLVADRDLESVRALLDAGPGIQPVDLYSVTGLPGADFQRMPYYPPHVAEEMLTHTVMHHGLYRIPAQREHFLSLSYHALYHKGVSSGLPVEATKKPAVGFSDHDYLAALRRLAAQAGFTTPITLHDLDSLLDSAGWRPPHDMLVRLSRRNRWVRSLLTKPESMSDSDDRLAVFLLREEALRRGGVERAAEMLRQRGLQIIATQEFESEQPMRIARTIRGGNWGRGPWPVSGGLPVAAIVVYDPAPVAPNRRQRRQFPFLANARLLCKEKLRACFNEDYPADQHCNVIHSSDNGREALDYLRITMPYRVEEVLSRVNSLHASRAAA
jgi:hypothetical protein